MSHSNEEGNTVYLYVDSVERKEGTTRTDNADRHVRPDTGS